MQIRSFKIKIRDYIFLLVTFLIIPFTFLNLGQDFNWDLQNYHLYIPITYFEGSFDSDIAPAGIQSYFNILFCLPAYLIHKFSNSPFFSFIMGLNLSFFQGLCGPIIFLVSKKLLNISKLNALICSLIGISGAILLSEAGTTFGDLTLSVLQLSSLLVCCTSFKIENKEKFKRLTLTWGILGASCGIKLSCIFFLPLIFFLTIASLEELSDLTIFQKLVNILKIIILPFFLSFSLFGLPWFALAWKYNKNPFFPTLTSIFGESILFKGNAHDARFVAKSFFEILIAPFRDFTNYNDFYNNNLGRRAELYFRDPRPLIAIYTGFFSFTIYLFRLRLTTNLRTFFSSGLPIYIWFQIGLFLNYVIWLKASGIGRYSISFQALFGISILISLMIIFNNFDNPSPSGDKKIGIFFKSQKFNLFLILFILIFCLTNTKIPNWGRMDFQKKWNSLQKIEYVNNKEIYKTFVADEFISPGETVVTLNQPLGWLKQFAPKESFNLLLPNKLVYRKSVIEKIKNNIINSSSNLKRGNRSKGFIVIQEKNENNINALRENTSYALIFREITKNSSSNLKKETRTKGFIVIQENNANNNTPLKESELFSSVNNQFNFNTTECIDYKAEFGLKLRKCDATLKD